VPARNYTSGKRKGTPVWSEPVDGTLRTIFMDSAKIEETKSIYEAKSGNCSECCGTCTEWAGWSQAEGTKYRPCRKCGATGLAAAGKGDDAK